MIASQDPISTHARARKASARAVEAFRSLRACDLCAWHCGTNRFQEPGRHCHAGVETRWFLAQTEVSDETELAPSFSIALSGCNLRCAYCITGERSWNALAGDPLNLKVLAARAQRALAQGARSIMVLGGEPTIHLPHVLALAAALPDSVPLIFKTNAYLSARARELLDGIFDLWLPDFKFGNDDCARRISRVENYTSVLQENLLWAARTQPGLMIRHLLMPGHIECCWKPVARWISQNLPETKVSLRTAFWPAWQTHNHPELSRPGRDDQALKIARSYRLRLIQ